MIKNSISHPVGFTQPTLISRLRILANSKFKCLQSVLIFDYNFIALSLYEDRIQRLKKQFAKKKKDGQKYQEVAAAIDF